MVNPSKKIVVCTNFRANPNHPSCAARGSKQILADLIEIVRENGMEITVDTSPCMGFCDIGPNAHLVPSGPFLHTISPHILLTLVEEAKAFILK